MIPDFRTPERLRLGLAPLYTRFADVHGACAGCASWWPTGRHLDFPESRSRVT